MARATYIETACKSFLNRVRGMPFRWSANPYRGCVHDCVYCFARTTHEFLELDRADFARVIQVKVNAPEVLRAELARPGWRRERVALGTATDPYQSIEGRYRITRACLGAFAAGRTPVTLVTKGTLVRRDLDVLQDLRDAAGVTVCISLPTIDPELWRRLEPGTPPPHQRLRALRALRDAGIHAGVLIAPILPALTTRAGHLETVVRQAVDHGAQFAGGRVLYLKPGVRDHFLAFLARDYPALRPAYHRLFAGTNPPAEYRDRAAALLARLRAEAGLGEDSLPPPAPAPEARQLPLWPPASG
jgi:DNA repair photolyase